MHVHIVKRAWPGWAAIINLRKLFKIFVIAGVRQGQIVSCCLTFNWFLTMEKFPCYEYVAGSSADGKLRMAKHCANAFIESHRDFIHGTGGVKRYHEWLALGAMCEELHRDIEAMDAYMEVFDHVMWDSSIRLSTRRRRHLKMQAIEGLLRLASSPEEVVWEICTQITYEWRNIG